MFEKSNTIMPTTDLLIVSCAKHFPWLRYSLRSVARFARGFRQVKILVPTEDLPAMSPLLTEFSGDQGIPIRVVVYDDWPGRGFLRHEHVIMCSDEFTDADFVCHLDSDCTFVEPVAPEDYFVGDKPVLMHATYEWLKNEVQANLDMWRVTVEEAIGKPVTREFMRRHPAVHHRGLYSVARACIKAHTGKDCRDYIKGCREEFPQSFCEFNTLGEVAWRLFHDDYYWVDHEQLHRTGTPWPNNKLVQWWTHQSPELPQSPIFRGQPWTGTPAELLKIV